MLIKLFVNCPRCGKGRLEKVTTSPFRNWNLPIGIAAIRCRDCGRVARVNKWHIRDKGETK